MEAENAHDFKRCIAAFAHPRYETSPPVAVQNVVFPVLAAIGRARGYSARYARYALPSE